AFVVPDTHAGSASQRLDQPAGRVGRLLTLKACQWNREPGSLQQPDQVGWIADLSQDRPRIAPEWPFPGQFIDQPRVILQAAGVEEGPRWGILQGSREATRILTLQTASRAAAAQVFIGKQVHAPRPHPRPQSREGGRSHTGPDQHEVHTGSLP